MDNRIRAEDVPIGVENAHATSKHYEARILHVVACSSESLPYSFVEANICPPSSCLYSFLNFFPCRIFFHEVVSMVVVLGISLDVSVTIFNRLSKSGDSQKGGCLVVS